MRFLFAAFLVSMFTSLASAQTDVRVEPVFPANCFKHDYPHLNNVYGKELVSEDAQFVTYTFRTFYSYCKDGNQHQIALDPQIVRVGFYKAKLFMPSLKDVAKWSHEFITDAVVEVTVTFDKSKVFAKGPHAKFQMIFTPAYGYQWVQGGWGQPNYRRPYPINFFWDVYLDSENGQTKFNVQVR